MSALVGKTLLTQDGTEVKADDVFAKKEKIALCFHVLVQEVQEEDEDKLEIVFVSSDKSEEEQVEYHKEDQGEWLRVPYSDVETRDALKREFGVCAGIEKENLGIINNHKSGIPCLVVLDDDKKGVKVFDGVNDVKNMGPAAVDMKCYAFHTVIEDPNASTADDLYKRVFADLVALSAETSRGALLLVIGSTSTGNKLQEQLAKHAIELTDEVSIEMHETAREGSTANQLIENTVCQTLEDLLACLSLGPGLMSSPYNDTCTVFKFRGGSATVINSSCRSLSTFIFPSIIRTIPSITHTCLFMYLPQAVHHPEALEGDLRRALALVGRRPVDAEEELDNLIVAWATKCGIEIDGEASRYERLQLVERKLSEEVERITDECARHRRRVSVLSDRLSEVAQFGILSGGEDTDKAIRDDLAASEQSRKELSARCEALEGAKAEIEAEKDRLAIEVGTHKRAEEKLKGEMLKWRRSLEMFQQQARAANQLQEQERDKTRLAEELRAAMEQIAKGKSAISESERECALAREECGNTKRELGSSRARIRELETQLDYRKAEAVDAGNKTARLEEEVDALREEVTSLTSCGLFRFTVQNSYIAEESRRGHHQVGSLKRRIAELTEILHETQATGREQDHQLTAALRLVDEKSHELEVVTAEVVALRSEKSSREEAMELSRLQSLEGSLTVTRSMVESHGKAELALAKASPSSLMNLSWRSQDLTRELEEAHNQMKAEIADLTEALAVAEQIAMEAQEQQQALSLRRHPQDVLDKRNNYCQTEVAGCALRLPDPSKSFDEFISGQVAAAASRVQEELHLKVHSLESAIERSRMACEDWRERFATHRPSRVPNTIIGLVEAMRAVHFCYRNGHELGEALAAKEDLRLEVVSLKERLKTTEQLHKEELLHLTEHDSKAMKDIMASRDGRVREMEASRLQASEKAAALKEKEYQIATLEGERSRLTAQIRDLRTDNMSLTARIGEISASLQRSNEENARKILDQQTSRTRRDEEASMQVAELEGRLFAMKEELSESSRLLMEHDAQRLASYNVYEDSLISNLQIKNYDETITELRVRCTQLEEELAKSHAAHSDQVRSLHEQNASVMDDMERLMAKATEEEALLFLAEEKAKSDAAEARKIESELREEVSSLRSQIDMESKKLSTEAALVEAHSRRAELMSMSMEDIRQERSESPAASLLFRSGRQSIGSNCLSENAKLEEQLHAARQDLFVAQTMVTQHSDAAAKLQELLEGKEQQVAEGTGMLQNDMSSQSLRDQRKLLSLMGAALEIELDDGIEPDDVARRVRCAVEGVKDDGQAWQRRARDLEDRLERAESTLMETGASATKLVEEFRAIMAAVGFSEAEQRASGMPVSLADEVRRLQGLASKSQSREAELDDRCARLQEELRECKSQLLVQQERLSTLNDELWRASECRTKMGTRVAELCAEVEETEEKLRVAREAVISRQNEVDEMKERNTQLCEALEGARESAANLADESLGRERELIAMMRSDSLARLMAAKADHLARVEDIEGRYRERLSMQLEDTHTIVAEAMLRERQLKISADWTASMLVASREHRAALTDQLDEMKDGAEDLREELERVQDTMVVEQGRHHAELQSLRGRLLDRSEELAARERLSMRLADCESSLASVECGRNELTRLLTAVDQLAHRWTHALEGLERSSMRCADYESRQCPESYALVTSGNTHTRKSLLTSKEMRSISELISSSRAEVNRFCKSTTETIGRVNERSQMAMDSLERASMANEDLMSQGWTALVNTNAIKVRAEHQRSSLQRYAKNICDKVVEVWHKHDRMTERLREAEASRDILQEKYRQAKQQVGLLYVA
ncbi:hypothetical protein FOL47_003553 [Perkinsus chesapeaki]|uniref:Thioredoxin-like fold domain-containing protein n=1 Tax=Perkinsus chesapeaki TaxID=330153 RepID=A0A7J6M7M4_PERCH|nr:hypothetical protein FOL47_003553 [Perkinsus chesapeaki]